MDKTVKQRLYLVRRFPGPAHEDQCCCQESQLFVMPFHTLDISRRGLTDRERLPGRAEFQVDCLGHVGARPA